MELVISETGCFFFKNEKKWLLGVQATFARSWFLALLFFHKICLEFFFLEFQRQNCVVAYCQRNYFKLFCYCVCKVFSISWLYMYMWKKLSICCYVFDKYMCVSSPFQIRFFMCILYWIARERDSCTCWHWCGVWELTLYDVQCTCEWTCTCYRVSNGQNTKNQKF